MDPSMTADKAADATGVTLVAAGSVASSIQQSAATWFPLVIGAFILIFRAIVEIQKQLYQIRHNARLEAIEAASHEIEEAKIAAVRAQIREESDSRHIQNQADIHAVRKQLDTALATVATLTAKVEAKRSCPLAVDGVPACEQHGQPPDPVKP